MAANCEMLVSSKPEYAGYGLSKPSCPAKFILSLKAPPSNELKRAPVSISVVLDRSGSMAGSKLDFVKRTSTFLLSQLRDQDSIALVTYDDNVEVPFKLQNATHQSKEAARACIKAIQAGSCTNLSGGLFKGIQQQLSTSREPGDWQLVDRPPVKAVFLFTDGLANVGLSDSSAIVAAMTKLMAGEGHDATKPSIQNSFKKLFSSSKSSDATACSAADAGACPQLKVHTFGFGSDHDGAMLQSIATAGNGTYFFIEKNENIPTAFADALGGLMSVYAQNIELVIKPAMPGVTIRKVHTGFKQTQAGDAHTVAMSDVYCEEQKDLIVEVDLPEASFEGNQTVVVASISYVDVLEGVQRSVDVNFDVTRVSQLPSDLNADEEVAAHWARIEAARAMEEAVQWAEQGDLKKAKEVMHAARELARKNTGMAADGTPGLPAPLDSMLRGITDDLEECEACFSSIENYRSVGSKKARAQCVSHKAQRSNGRWALGKTLPGSAAQAPPVSMYANAMQARMSRAAEAAVLEEDSQVQVAGTSVPVQANAGPMMAQTAATVPPQQAPSRRRSFW